MAVQFTDQQVENATLEQLMQAATLKQIDAVNNQFIDDEGLTLCEEAWDHKISDERLGAMFRAKLNGLMEDELRKLAERGRLGA